jgi:hypothetical protein
MSYSPTIINLNVTTIVPLESSNPHPNLYGMLIHASPNNTVNVKISLAGSGSPPVFTLTPDSSIRLGPEHAANTAAVYAAAADGSTSSAVEIIL